MVILLNDYLIQNNENLVYSTNFLDKKITVNHEKTALF